jgi:hypothetical protein
MFGDCVKYHEFFMLRLVAARACRISAPPLA